MDGFNTTDGLSAKEEVGHPSLVSLGALRCGKVSFKKYISCKCMTPLEQIEQKRRDQWERDNDSFHKRMDQDETRRHNREIEISERIKASGLSRDGYAVQHLLDESRKGISDIEEIHMCDLGFSMDILAWREINALFDALKKDGCLKTYERKVNEWVKIQGLNSKRLEKQMRRYHPSHTDPTSARRKLLDAITVVTAVCGVTFSAIFGYLDYKKSGEIESLKTDVQVLENKIQLYFEPQKASVEKEKGSDALIVDSTNDDSATAETRVTEQLETSQGQ